MRLSLQKLLAVWVVTLSCTFTLFGQNDLSLGVSTTSGTVAVGDNGIQFTVTVTNEGATTVNDVEATITIPGGLDLTGNSPSAGTYNAGSGVWDIGTIASGTGSVTLTLTFDVLGEGVQTVQAFITNMAEIDGDSDPTDNSVLEDDYGAACVTAPFEYCAGETIDITATAPAGHNNYQWQLNGMDIPGATSQNYNITAAGSYSYTISAGATGNCAGGSCCDIIVTELTLPTVDIDTLPATSVLTCTTPSIDLTASGGASYAWSNGDNTATTTITTPNTYTVTVTAANGCTATGQVVITQDITPPTVDVDTLPATSVLTCTTTSIDLTASGGVSYAWSNGDNTATTSITTPNTYTVTVTAANGCTATSQVVITQDITPPTVDIDTLPATSVLTCTTTSIDLTASGGASYAWSNGDNTATTSITTPNTYTVTVTAANGCTATSQVVITQDITPPTVDIDTLPATSVLTCTTTSIDLTASGGASYAWSNGDNTATTSITTPNTYTVTVTAANGCTATSQVVITQDITPPTVDIDTLPATSVLTCTTTSIDLTASGGASYAWSNGDNTAATSITTPNTYTVTVTAANGCTATGQVVITQDITPPTVDIDTLPATSVLTCATTSIDLTASGGASYAWSNGDNTATTSITTPNTYTVTVTAANGCTATSQVVITQDITPPTVDIDTLPATSVLTCTTTSIDLTASGGASYAWSNGDNTATTSITTPNTYTVTVTAANGCTATSQVVITQDITPPLANITNDDLTTEITCLQTSISLTATGGISYAWSTGDNTANISVSTAGTYTVTVTGPNGCTATAQEIITGSCTVDYADLPDDGLAGNGPGDYNTLSANNGPSHGIITGLTLGTNVDAEADGQPSANADGDDTDGTDDDDGMSIGSTFDIVPGGTIRIPYDGNNSTGNDANLVAWVDWNNDGVFSPGEQVTPVVIPGTGAFSGHLAVPVPEDATTGSNIGILVRLSNSAIPSPGGYLSSGEVESYQLSVNCPTQICLPATSTKN